MRKFLSWLTFSIPAAVFCIAGVAHAEDHMFFNCQGTDGETMAITLVTSAYSAGSVQGFAIQRRGLYDSSNDQNLVTDKIFAKVSYKPSNPKYKGLEKYVVDTSKDNSMAQTIFDWLTGKPLDSSDFSQYEVLVPPRVELEKIWRSPSDKQPNGEFDAYVQVRFSSGDRFVLVPLHCGLNWRQP